MARPSFRPGLIGLMLLAGTLCAPAARADDADALLLADSAPSVVQVARDWQGFAESGFGQSSARLGASSTSNQRLSLDVRLDKALAPGWRAVLADRLDANWPAQNGTQHSINTLKEAYLSWQPQAEHLIDLGRVNARYGVATGYNPTDFLGAGAIRSLVSVDPGSLKKNRLGSVMLRGQVLWAGGSLGALVAPELAEPPSAAPFSLDLGATNRQTRWLLAASQRWSEHLNPQWLLTGGPGQASQLGLNLTTLLGDANVAVLEWSGARSPTQWSQALRSAEQAAWHNRLAVGLTHTTPGKLSLTLEYHHNSAALGDAAWNALALGQPQAYLQYRQWVQDAQELPTQQALFLGAGWTDAGLPHLDLSAMLRLNLADRSRLQWFEARYHFDQFDIALQWQGNQGSASSEYGAAAQSRAWQVLLRRYL